jgi:predicted RNase H-like HicB family nuclease
MKTFTAMLHAGEPGEGGYWATCLEVPGANGQGETREEYLENLADGIRLILEVCREEAAQEAPVLEECVLAVG